MFNPSLISYVAVMSVTPGPNNVLLATSGVNFGFKRTLPMSLGVSIGAGLQCLITLQMVSLIEQWLGQIRIYLAVTGCLYLLWLSWKIYHATMTKSRQEPRPFTFIQMAVFQWINPKAWIMAINTAVLFGTQHLSDHIAIVCLYILTNLPCILLWVLLGDRLRQFLQQPVYRRLVNSVMAIIMAITALCLVADVG